MIQLRNYQDETRTKLRVALRASASVLCVLPPRAGKTVLAAALIDALFKAGKRVIFCVHRVDLITQTAKTFDKFDIPYSYIAAGHHYNPMHRIYIASIATLANRLGRIKADFIFVDEAHLSMAAGWAKVAKHYKDVGAKLIGLTGSPERLDGKPLGDVWDAMVEGPSVSWMMENGHLSGYRAFCPKGLIDYSGVRVRGGKMVEKDIEDLEQGKAVIKDAAKHWREKAEGLRTIAFCRSVDRAQEYADEFNNLGIPSVALDANTPQSVRKQAFIDFADGRLKVIFNCALFCEGFDLAAQVDRDVTVECVMLLTPTQSLARHIQQIMRCMTKKKFLAVILDLVGNLARLGFPDDEREWSLDGKVKNKREVEMATCPECSCSHHPAPKCPECGHEYPAKPVAAPRTVQEVDGDLEEVDIEALRRARNIEQAAASTLTDLINLATARGYKSPEKWAGHVWTAREAKKQGAGQ